MRKFFAIPLIIALIALLIPGLVPNIAVSQKAMLATAAVVEISPGGQAQACNLVLDLCCDGVSFFCDLFWIGQYKGWWN